MKISKKLILTSFLLLAGVIIISILVLGIKNDNKGNSSKINETTYVAYVDINPLIKLNFKVSCKDDDCAEPVVTDYELINEDAKTIYKDLVIKDKSLNETIELLGNTVKDKEIVFSEIHIYTNYDKEDVFKVDSVDYSITLDVKNDEDLEQFISDLITKDETIKTKEVLVPFLYSLPQEMLNQDPKSLDSLTLDPDITATIIEDGSVVKIIETHGLFKFLEYEELYTIMTCPKKNFKSENNDDKTMEVNALKVTISGPQELIDTIPNTLCGYSNEYIEAMLKITEAKVGEYVSPINISSKNPKIRILSPTSINVKFRIIRIGDDNVSAIIK